MSKQILLKKNTGNKLIKSIPQPIRTQINLIKLFLLNLIYRKEKLEFKNDNLFWYDNTKNFGDWIGPYLFEKITGRHPIKTMPNNKSKNTVVSSVGSIVNLTKSNTIIWGSGIMQRKQFFQKPYKVLSVRGPITRQRFLELGYECPQVYGDPAMLLPQFFRPKFNTEYKIGIIPHDVDYSIISNLYNNEPNILVINVLDSVENVINFASSCEIILSSSLHGCIIANAYHIPSAWIKISNNLPGDNIKFYDHYLSLGMIDVLSPIVFQTESIYTPQKLKNLVESFPQYDPKKSKVNIDTLLNVCPFYN